MRILLPAAACATSPDSLLERCHRSWSKWCSETPPGAPKYYVVGDAYEHHHHHAFDVRLPAVGSLDLQLPMLFGLHVVL